MTVSIQQLGEWWALVAEGGPIRTPMGTPVVSRHRALLEEVAADAGRWGSDPTARTTTFSLQCSYLDFGLRVRREVLEENTAAIWPDDLFAQRPADPALAAALLALWGPVDLDRGAFRERLRGATLRQVLAAMTAGHVLRSAVLGWRVIAGGLDPAAAARGACGRWFDAQQRRVAGPGAAIAATRRHVPTDLDAPFCEGCCAGAAEADGAFALRCALHPLLDKLRRWSAFPEETVPR
jgi:hypothetical protein